jgi:hypothetical protein
MKSNPQEETIDLGELVRPAYISTQSPVEASALNNREKAIEQHFSALVERIPRPLQKGTLHIFIELQHLLRYLDLIEEGVTQERELNKAVQSFSLIYNRASALIGKMNTLASQAGRNYETLGSTLEGIGFAIKHELRRVSEGIGLALNSRGDVQPSRADVATSYGILQNCFQQATIAMAQVFDPTLDGTAIFEDYKVKQEQSVMLRRELTLLLQKARKVEKEAGILQKLYFVNNLKQFHQEMMHFLMYRDWEEFEGFVNEIIKTIDEVGNLVPVLHRFTSYLETLLNHVSMRAVLNERPSCPAEMMF